MIEGSIDDLAQEIGSFLDMIKMGFRFEDLNHEAIEEKAYAILETTGTYDELYYRKIFAHIGLLRHITEYFRQCMDAGIVNYDLVDKVNSFRINVERKSRSSKSRDVMERYRLEELSIFYKHLTGFRFYGQTSPN